jgi:hypothetical protein
MIDALVRDGLRSPIGGSGCWTGAQNVRRSSIEATNSHIVILTI